MPVRPLKSFFSTADELLAADLPRLGEVLLVHLNSYENRVKQHGGLNRGYLRAMLDNRNVGLGPLPPTPEYGERQPEITRRMMEAWNWLEREGVLMHNPEQPHPDWFLMTRAGEDLLKRFELQQKWERAGVNFVKNDLLNTVGAHVLDVGKPAKQRDWAWVQMKENQAKPPPSPNSSAETEQLSRKVFVVHGHDEAAREKIARFLEHLDFEPIILHEQASRGRTVIEKVEAHSDVGFAVVLLTPDDEGCEKGGAPRPRARQNVVLELGYFLGRLGRTHVCALKRGDIEIPSDFQGVVYVDFDDSDGWRQALGRELKAVGLTIDWNRVMGTHA
jgi:predicted nucleotide-binding protein